eukprot:scaffold377162_cov63-Attheya_sp.AAC.1
MARPPMASRPTMAEERRCRMKASPPAPTRKRPNHLQKKTVQKAIENCGNNQIETSENLITQIKLEFNISKDTKAFNPRVKHLEVLKLMKAVDPTLMVKSAHDDMEWDSFLEFPRNAADYQKHFNLKDDSNPPWSKESDHTL